MHVKQNNVARRGTTAAVEEQKYTPHLAQLPSTWVYPKYSGLVPPSIQQLW
jgi:hypothetical protein